MNNIKNIGIGFIQGLSLFLKWSQWLDDCRTFIVSYCRLIAVICNLHYFFSHVFSLGILRLYIFFYQISLDNYSAPKLYRHVRWHCLFVACCTSCVHICTTICNFELVAVALDCCVVRSIATKNLSLSTPFFRFTLAELLPTFF